MISRGERWCVEDEHCAVVGDLFDGFEAAAEQARAMVEAVGTGVVYLPLANSIHFDALRVP